MILNKLSKSFQKYFRKNFDNIQSKLHKNNNNKIFRCTCRNRILIENDRMENRKSSARGHYVNIQESLQGLRISGHGSMSDSVARKSDPMLFSSRHIEP